MAPLYIMAVSSFIAFAALYKMSISRDCCIWVGGLDTLFFKHLYALIHFHFLGVGVDGASNVGVRAGKNHEGLNYCYIDGRFCNTGGR